MPRYRVQLKQGRRTIVNQIEARSVENVKAFFDEVSTMKVTEILEIKYSALTDTIPNDDFNYHPIVKMFIKNTKKNMSFQLVLNNIKPTKNEDDLYQACTRYLTIAGGKVDSITTSLFKAR